MIVRALCCDTCGRFGLLAEAGERVLEATPRLAEMGWQCVGRTILCPEHRYDARAEATRTTQEVLDQITKEVPPTEPVDRPMERLWALRRGIMWYLHEEGWTMEAIGKVFNCRRQAVSKTLAKAGWVVEEESREEEVIVEPNEIERELLEQVKEQGEVW